MRVSRGNKKKGTTADLKTSSSIAIKGEILQAASITAVMAVALAFGWLAALERPVADVFMRIPRLTGPPGSEVAVVVIDDRSVQTFGPVPWPRDRIATLIQRVTEIRPQAVVLDTILSERRSEKEDDALRRVLQGSELVLAAALSPDGGWLLPADEFGGSRVAAHAHAETDTDGIVRSIAATKQASGLALPALSIAAAGTAGWTGSIRPGQLLRPDFRLAPSSVVTVSAADVLQTGSPPQPQLTGRVVFIGYSASGIGDRYLVPVGDRNRPSPGVLVHAAVTDSLLRGGLLVPLPSWMTLSAVFLMALGVQILRTRSGRLRPRDIFLSFVIILVITLCLLWFAQVIVPTVALVLAAVSSAVVREAVESRAAQRETGSILRSLLEEEGFDKHPAMPRGVHGRLELVRTLQDQLTLDRNLRRTLLEGMNEGVVLWNETGETLVSNAALNCLWGHAPSMVEVRELRPDTGGTAADSTMFEVDRNGRRLEIQLLGIGVGHLGLVRDITERSELDRRRREMHRLVSHELKTPLASIAGFGEMLQTYELSKQELQRVAGMITGEADRLGEMVRAFLDIERLGSLHWEAERTEIDLGSVARERAQVLSQAASSRSQTITVDVADAPSVSGVKELLSQLVDNLVGNAFKYSPDGSEIRVVVAPRDDGRVELKVSDRGPGIPEDSVPQLFEKFYRVPGSKTSGSGLGLAFVKETADWHGATVLVETKVGEGSCFSVLFPTTGESR